MILPILSKQRNYKKNFEQLDFVAKRIKDIGQAENFAIIEILKQYGKLTLLEISKELSMSKDDTKDCITQLISKNLIIESVKGEESIYLIRDKKLVKIFNYIKNSKFFIA